VIRGCGHPARALITRSFLNVDRYYRTPDTYRSSAPVSFCPSCKASSRPGRQRACPCVAVAARQMPGTALNRSLRYPLVEADSGCLHRFGSDDRHFGGVSRVVGTRLRPSVSPPLIRNRASPVHPGHADRREHRSRRTCDRALPSQGTRSDSRIRRSGLCPRSSRTGALAAINHVYGAWYGPATIGTLSKYEESLPWIGSEPTTGGNRAL